MNQYSRQAGNTATGRLHCPNCRSNQLSALVESADSVSIFTDAAASKGFGMATHGVTAANRNYWVCHECGHKFRNIENLQAEIQYVEKEMKTSRNIARVSGVIALILMLLAVSADDFLMVVLCAPFVVSAVCAALWFWMFRRNKKMIARLTEEKRHLDEHCYS